VDTDKVAEHHSLFTAEIQVQLAYRLIHTSWDMADDLAAFLMPPPAESFLREPYESSWRSFSSSGDSVCAVLLSLPTTKGSCRSLLTERRSSHQEGVDEFLLYRRV
jgi:hypothetical protein